MTQISSKNHPQNRYHGLDILRCLSMLFVVILHVLNCGKGGNLDHAFLGSPNYLISWFLEFGSLCAVNCFALITGYIGITIKYQFNRFIYLWFQVIFYTLTSTIVFKIFSPEKVTIELIIRSLIPVFGKSYWYFTAYAILFFFIPYINKCIHSLSHNQAKQLCLSIIIVFSGLSVLFGAIDLFNSGASVIWLSCLYAIGACIQKFNLFQKLESPLLYYTITVFISTFSFVAWNYIPYLSKTSGIYFTSYMSPLILFSSIFLFVRCLRIKIQSNRRIQILSFFAPLSFAVYLIHCEPLIKNNLFSAKFEIFQSYPWYVTPFAVLGVSIAIYLFCSLIDYIRLLIFRLLFINKLSLFIESEFAFIKNKALTFIK